MDDPRVAGLDGSLAKVENHNIISDKLDYNVLID
jgi:hypothetical protein